MTLSPSYPEPAAAAATDARTAKARSAPAGLLGRVKIRTRLILLSSALLIILVGTNLYLTRKLSTNAAGMVETAELLRTIEQANNAQITFGEVRYWMADLAVSLLTLPEQNAKAAHARMERYLDQLAVHKPVRIVAVREELAKYDELAAKAVDEYTADRRVIGNSLLAQSRQHGVAVDKLLGSIVTELTEDAVAARDRVVAEAGIANRVSQIVTLATVLAGALLTFFVLRSIARPLRRLVVAMDGLNAGNTAVEIPAPGPDEMGAMARTLAAFRDTTQELRESLEQQRAIAEVLGVINSSPGELGPVFDALLEKATRLCEASSGLMWTTIGERFQAVAVRGMSPEFVEFLRDPDNQPRMVASNLPIGRVVRGELLVHVLDLVADEFTHEPPALRKLVGLGGFRTILALPLRNDAALLGAFVVGRREVRPFTYN